ncbi:unnamed protein product [Calypogeia fissa]
MASSAGGDDGTAELSSALLEDAERLYNLGCAAIRNESFDEAVDCFSKALEIRVQCYGELGPECAQTYYKFGCALLYKAQTESDAVVDSKVGKGQSSSAAEGSKFPDQEDDSDDEEDGKNEGEGIVADDETGEDEESDLELAWKVLDIARVIYAKGAERTLAEIDVIIALADVSLERELFPLCFDDYATALSALENLVEADNRRIAELCFKISLAKQMDQKPQEALDFCKRAISVCERRIERLNRELKKEPDRTPGKGVEVTGECALQTVSDAEEVAQVNDSELSSAAELKEVGEAVQKLVSSEDVVKVIGDDAAQGKDLKLSVETESKAEVKELAELLVDLRERVEELQQMAAAPSLLDALKASNPEAAAMMKEVYSSTLGITTLGNGGSDTSQVGSSSTAPVTNLGVVGRGVKRATLTPIVDEQSSEIPPKKRTAEDVLKGGSSGETQNGFGGHS